MHELSIAEGILDRIAAVDGMPKRLETVRLRLGPLSGVSADALRFCFTEAARARGFGAPALEIEETRLEWRCERCGAVHQSEDPMQPCPACGERRRELVAGNELIVESVDVADDGDQEHDG